MESKTSLTMDHLEQKLSGWEKWLYASFSVAIIMLAHAFIKDHENIMLTNALFFMEDKAELVRSAANADILSQYYSDLAVAYLSPARLILWLAIQSAIFACAAVLAFFRPWRKVNLSKRMDLIFGFLLAAWINLLALGAQDPLNIPGEYNVLVVIYLLALGLGYWWQGRKKDKAEEVFP
ncbi:MAG: hypothetical protein HY867_04610 [Chloroflexi bacterium]|nr:hypothetical protein [Chloroflexota bacterium]